MEIEIMERFGLIVPAMRQRDLNIQCCLSLAGSNFESVAKLPPIAEIAKDSRAFGAMR